MEQSQQEDERNTVLKKCCLGSENRSGNLLLLEVVNGAESS